MTTKNPVTVVFTGAGASVALGYPLASDLCRELKANGYKSDLDAIEHCISKLECYNTFKPYLSIINLFRQGILEGQNINLEATLTAFDLLPELSYNEKEEKASFQVYCHDPSSEENLDKFYNSGKFDGPINQILVFLIKVISLFFENKDQGSYNYISEKIIDKPPPNYKCLTSILDKANYVITTNYDCAAEIILSNKLNKFSVYDGYGFKFKLTNGHYIAMQEENFQHKSVSNVKVFKLHGTWGWKQCRTGNYLDTSLIKLIHPKLWMKKDRNRPDDYYQGNNPSSIIAPTYIKKHDDPWLQTAWRKSFFALQRADHIIFIGYSFPEADIAVRLLLTAAIHNKLTNNKVKITIIDPDPKIKEKVETLFNVQENINIHHFSSELKDGDLEKLNEFLTSN